MPKRITIENVKPGMKLAKPILNRFDNVLLYEGSTLTIEHINMLKVWDIYELFIDDKVDEVPEPEEKVPVETVTEQEFEDLNKQTVNEVEKTITEARDAIEEVKLRDKKIINQVKQIHNKALDSVNQVLTGAKIGKKIDINRTKKTVEEILVMITDNKDIFLNLTGMSEKSNYLFKHSINVATYALIVGNNMGYDNEQMLELGLGALVHDVGMMRIPEEIYNKPERLTEEEKKLLRRHPEFGISILKDTPGLSKSSILIALQHHEHYGDKKGYPNKISKEQIHEYSRIVTVADAYDSMLNERPFRPAMNNYQAMKEIIANSGFQFDPVIVKHFVLQLAVYPIGTFVRLNTNEIGMVCKVNEKLPLRPYLRVLFDDEGKKVTTAITLNLLKDKTRFIQRVISPTELDLDGIDLL